VEEIVVDTELDKNNTNAKSMVLSLDLVETATSTELNAT